MEKGLILTLLSALCFAGTIISLRRGMAQAGESFSAVLISIFVGAVLLLLLLPFSGGWEKLWALSWQGFTLLGIAGIIHFVVGRLLFYHSVRFIGANKASPLVQTSPFYAVILGVLFLDEPLTTFLVAGVLSMAVGATLVSLEKEGEIIKMHGRGILNGLGAALCWGVSGVLVRPVVEEIGSASATVLISYIVALPIVAVFLLRQKQRDQLIQLHRASLILLVIAGILALIGQLLRYEALIYSPVSVVTSLLSTHLFFVLMLSFLLNRNIEIFTWKVLIGVVAVAAGTFLLFR